MDTKNEPSPLDKIKARLAALYLEVGQATAKGDLRHVVELQAQIKVVISNSSLSTATLCPGAAQSAFDGPQ
jgi:hypothetical protein